MCRRTGVEEVSAWPDQSCFHTSTSISSSCSRKQVFFIQQPTSGTRPPSPLWPARETKSGSSHLSDAVPRWHVQGTSRPHAPTHRRRPGRNGREQREPCEVRKGGNESRSEGMACTAWHLNRGFPPCTSSSLCSCCLHKGWLFTHSWYESAGVLCRLSVHVVKQQPRLFSFFFKTFLLWFKAILFAKSPCTQSVESVGGSTLLGKSSGTRVSAPGSCLLQATGHLIGSVSKNCLNNSRYTDFFFFPKRTEYEYFGFSAYWHWWST